MSAWPLPFSFDYQRAIAIAQDPRSERPVEPPAEKVEEYLRQAEHAAQWSAEARRWLGL